MSNEPRPIREYRRTKHEPGKCVICGEELPLHQGIGRKPITCKGQCRKELRRRASEAYAIRSGKKKVNKSPSNCRQCGIEIPPVCKGLQPSFCTSECKHLYNSTLRRADEF